MGDLDNRAEAAALVEELVKEDGNREELLSGLEQVPILLQELPHVSTSGSLARPEHLLTEGKVVFLRSDSSTPGSKSFTKGDQLAEAD